MASRLKAGDFFSGCEILSECGTGAFGITYLARNPIGQKIIIKIVTSPVHRQREMEGVRNYMLVSGKHPNLLQIFHVGEWEDGFYYIMEAADSCSPDPGQYVPATLKNLFREKKRFAPDEAIQMIRDLLSGLNLMHRSNLIHRDIKPDNIIFVNGKAKLSDPGLVIQVGQEASFAGTFGFIPPEVAAGSAEHGQNSDLYAIGKVFYCIVTGLHANDFPQFPMDLPVSICRQIYPLLIKSCGSDPGKRFQTADEFLDGLPHQLRSPSKWESFRENFKNWRILNPEKFRMILFLFLIFFSLAISAVCFAVKSAYEQNLKEQERRDSVEQFMKINQDRPGLTEFQIRFYLPERLKKYQDLQTGLRNEIRKQRWGSAEKTVSEYKTFLADSARVLLPAVPQKNGTFAADIAVSGKLHSFMATPLFQYLPESEKKVFSTQTKAWDNIIYENWNGPRCGENWVSMNDYLYTMIYVPSGALTMKHSGKTVEIPYSFWISKNELTHELYSTLMEISPQKSPNPNTPLERAAWNDLLYFCYLKTMEWDRSGLLPPGHIVRPPTEQEWEYAANNGWLGEDSTPLEQCAVIKTNSGGRTWQPGTKLPNKLGLNDIYGNVAEIVLPFQPPAMQNAVIVRGGSFRNSAEECSRQIEYLAYQCIPYDIGFRPVIAPGTLEYFDTHFFLSGPQQCRINGKVYELIGGNYAAFDWKNADQLSRLLGGSLAELQNKTLISSLKKEIPLFGQWPVFVGGINQSGVWTWYRSGNEIFQQNISKSRTKANAQYLSWQYSRFQAVADERYPIFLCEWEESKYKNRNNQLFTVEKHDAELHRFQKNGRTFMLINSSMPWFSAYRFCELLGGRLACLDSDELLQEVIRELKPFRDKKIFLGAYAKRENWFWINNLQLKQIPRILNEHSIPGKNRNYLVLSDGALFNAYQANAFLCEWLPLNSQ